MAAIEMKNIVKKYADGFPAVNDISIDIADGEFVILVGPSGCGKSTLLRMIVGLEDITEGDMVIGGKRVNDKAPRDRNLSMVFQNYALYPHLTVFENIAFPMRLSKTPDAEVKSRVHEASSLLELDEHLERKPANLSGGQRQRVAMGRAIVRDADAFLFDEPLSNLDAKLRGQMRTEISRLQRRLGITTVYVTHDQTEAMTLGDRVAVMKKGVLQQIASPRELYEQPVNLFVAGFIGSPPMNFVPVEVRDGHLDTPLGPIALTTDRQREAAQGHDVMLMGVRPEAFEDSKLVDPDKREKGDVFTAQIDVTEWLGNEQYAYIPFDASPEVEQQLKDLSHDLDSDQLRTQLIIAIDAASRIRAGRKAEIWVDTRKMHLFDPKTGENLTRDAEAGARITAEVEEERREELEEARNAPPGEAPDGGGRDAREPERQGGGAHRA